MAAAESKSVMLQQLSRQLHAVSEIAESLTLRLLALEERFEQLHLDAWSDGTDSGQDETSQQLLDDSGDRLRHLRLLLDEDAPEQGSGLVTAAAAEMNLACVDGQASDREDLDEPDLVPSLNETVYVDDPQIDPADEDDNDQDRDDQFNLLSA